MKKKAFFLPLLAAFALASCSSDEILDNAGGNQPGKFVGDVAYMTVNIQDVNSLTKATVDGGYENGSNDEHKVSSARFFFFDENGVFVSEASVWMDSTATTPNQNVEYIGKNVIVLENLTETGLPSYLLTVLNAPTFKVAATLEQTAEALTDWNNGLENANGKFVMSTASYFGEKTNHVDFADAKNGGGARYYATKVNTTDFRKEPYNLSAIDLGVTIYVERLAAKVQLGLGETFKQSATGKEKNLYQVKASVAGNPNDGGSAVEGTTDLYVKFTGWGLNATAKQTYLSKQLKEEWNEDNVLWGASWNNADDFRSFWAESYIYGKDLKNTPEKNAYLNYVKYSDLKAVLNDSVKYCNENTNAPKNILKDITDNLGNETKAVIPSYTTSVLVKAEICDKDGNGLDLVRYNGLLYKKDQFLQYVLNTIDLGAEKIDIWKKTEETTDESGKKDSKYIQIADGEVKLAQAGGNGVGDVIVAGNLDAKVEYYYKTKTEAGKDTFCLYPKTVAGENETTKTITAAEQLEEYLKGANSMVGEAFTGGAMYYNIPIEHLAAQSVLNKTNETEGYYGVVRNHWYKLTIDNVANVGHGVFRPAEGEGSEKPIIPEEPEDPRYYLGAQINILSWKVVNQNVGL